MTALRDARLEDARLLRIWRNDPETRRMFRDSRAIPWDEHVAWLTHALGDERVRVWIGEADGRPVGVVRLTQVTAEAADVSIIVDPGARWRGYGTALLKAACARAADAGLGSIEARVKLANAASRALFARAGFEQQGMQDGLAIYRARGPARTEDA